MNSGSSDPDNGESQIISELQDLRDDFQDYADTSNQYQTSRRVENIQVLIALSVVAGTISLYTSGFFESQIWETQLQTRYWVKILEVFIAANGVFLMLKLITIPLLPVTDEGWVAFVHEEVEPFLYFFAVLGVVAAFIVRILAIPLFEGLSGGDREALAYLSLIIPMAFATVYSQSYRINSALQRERPLYIETNQILDGLVQTGTITAEAQTKLMRSILKTMTPTPAIILILDAIQDGLESVFGLSEETVEIMNEINSFLAKSVIYGVSSETSSFLSAYNQSLEEIIIDEQIEEKELSTEELERLRNRVRELRNRAAHGELSEQDIMDLHEYLESLQDSDENE